MVEQKEGHAPGCDGNCDDGLKGLSVPELVSILATRKAMLVWAVLLYPVKGSLRSLVN